MDSLNTTMDFSGEAMSVSISLLVVCFLELYEDLGRWREEKGRVGQGWSPSPKAIHSLAQFAPP